MQLTLLKPANRQPRPVTTLQRVQDLGEPEGLWGVDIETRGVDPTDPQSCIVGIGLANERGAYYWHVATASDADRRWLKGWLRQVQLTAFNVKFDGAFLQVWVGEWLNWDSCSYGLFRYCATEGFADQEWNLETAQRQVLGWETSNKAVLNAALQERNLTKADMWRLPADILGPYCGSDADAAWQLQQEIVAQVTAQGFTHLLDFHRREFLTEVELFVEQQLRGIAVNKERLAAYYESLTNRFIPQAMDSFLKHPLVAHHIDARNQEVRAAWIAAEPALYTAKGEISKRWEGWRDREQAWMDSKGFNPNSKQQLAKLFYEQVFSVVSERGGITIVQVDGKRYEVEKTKGGARSVKKQILPIFGEPGALLMEYNKLVKEAGYVRAALKMVETRSTMHPEINITGTVTRRPAGGDTDDD